MTKSKEYFSIDKTSSGIRYFIEENKSFPSVIIGVFVKSGSRYESKNELGIAHFIEHAVFKGTKRRTSFQVSHEIERLGGGLNAYTSSEYSLFYTKLLSKHAEKGFDILSDILINPLFNKTLLNRERAVIMEEINEYYDTPQDICQAEVLRSIWGDNSIANNPLGEKKTVEKLKRSDLLKWFNNSFSKENIFVSVVGDIDKKTISNYIEEYFSNMPTGNEIDIFNDPPAFSFQKRLFKKDGAQIHLAITLKGEKSFSRRSILQSMYTTILGGNMSSRLFQKLREKSGLVYTVYAYPVSFSDTGGTVIYASALPENIEKVENIINKEIDNIRVKGLSKEEFQDVREYILGNLVLGLESSSGRMQRNGVQGMFQGKIKSIKTLMQEVESVRFDEFLAFARDISLSERGKVLVGGSVE